MHCWREKFEEKFCITLLYSILFRYKCFNVQVTFLSAALLVNNVKDERFISGSDINKIECSSQNNTDRSLKHTHSLTSVCMC